MKSITERIVNAGRIKVQPQSPIRDPQSSSLPVAVVYTSASATVLALKRAGNLAKELDARIRVIVPQVVPYPLPLDQPAVYPERAARRFLTRIDGHSIESQIEVLLCRDAAQAIHQMVAPESLLVLGGRASWWPTREKRLAKDLRRAGHHVIFVPEN